MLMVGDADGDDIMYLEAYFIFKNVFAAAVAFKTKGM